jgi:hypothetical protein
VLRRMEARGRNETAHRVRAQAGRVLRYALATGRAQYDVAEDLRDALAPVKSHNFASVTRPARVGEINAGDQLLQRTPGDCAGPEARTTGIRSDWRIACGGMVGV